MDMGAWEEASYWPVLSSAAPVSPSCPVCSAVQWVLRLQGDCHSRAWQTVRTMEERLAAVEVGIVGPGTQGALLMNPSHRCIWGVG